MSRPGTADVPVFEFRPATPAWGAEFLRRVATRLASAPLGTGVLIERLAGAPAPLLVPSAPEGATLITTAAEELPGRLLRRNELPPLVLRPVDSVAFAVLGRPSLGPGAAARDPGGRHGPEPAEPHRVFPATGRPFDRNLGASVQFHWFPGGPDGLRVWPRVRVAAPADHLLPRLLATSVPIAESLGQGPGPSVRPVVVRDGWRARRAWRNATLPGLQAAEPIFLRPERAAASVPGPPPPPFPRDSDLALHTVVVGASGSGKTSLLADVAARRLNAGRAVVLIDVHGDLAPATAARLGQREPRRLAAIDGTVPIQSVTGVPVLVPDSDDEQEAQELVAALKRLSADGSELYWGFRMERLFDSFVRLTLEEGGDLGDLAEMLTDPRRREAARLTTRRPELARFLEELPPVERRNPEFLWPAATRLSKVLLSDRLRALLAPPDGGVPLGPWLGEGGSVMIRIPSPVLGPEATSFAATLLATRAYLSAVRSAERVHGRTLLFVLDEAQAFSPRLVTEILAEGRKFGVALLVATQYPERWPPELRAAAAGSAGSHLMFRVPAAAAGAAGAWVGLAESDARHWLPTLPVGHAIAATPGAGPRLIAVGAPPSSGGDRWATLVRLAGNERSGEYDPPSGSGHDDLRLLFAIWEGSERGSPAVAPTERSGPGVADHRTESERTRVVRLIRKGWVEAIDGRLTLSPAGGRVLGIGGPTGAPSESLEHRALIVEAARIFLRNGLRLEPVRQGRFDTRLPDARVLIAPAAAPTDPPAERYERLEAARRGWGWRYFRGQDVHVEAEVSGALRPDRIRRGLAKGQRAGAYVLFLVGDERRARRIRSVLRSSGAYPTGATVWTLTRAARRGPEERLHRPP